MSESETVPIIDIYGDLKCPICLDFAASPIHTCENGHIVCGICKEKTNVCPTCRAGNLKVCDFLERVLKAKGVVVQCRNSQLGCTLLVPPSEMKTHLADSCDFRPIQCHGREICDGKSYHPKALLQHWIDIHYADEVNLILPSSSTSSKGLLGTVTRYLDLTEEGYQRNCRTDARRCSWPFGYIEKEIDGRTFMLHCTCEGGIFRACVTLLGMESDATKYGFVATLTSCQDNPLKRMTFPRIPIHSVQYYFSKKVDDLGHTVAVVVRNLKSIQDEKPSDPKNTLEWDVRFDIFGFEDHANMELK